LHRMQATGFGSRDIGEREIRILGIDGGSPFDSAQRAAFARIVLPDHFTFFLDIEGEADPGFLTDHDYLATIRKVSATRRVSEIQIRAVLFGAIRIAGSAAAREEDVRRCNRAHPPNLAGFHFDRDYGVARWLRWTAISVTGGDIDQAALGVDRWRGPDG